MFLLLTNAASAPWRPSHASAGNAPHKIFPKTVKFGGGPSSGDLSEGSGEIFGGLTLFNTAAYQEPLDCNHSMEHNFKEEWEGGTMQN